MGVRTLTPGRVPLAPGPRWQIVFAAQGSRAKNDEPVEALRRDQVRRHPLLGQRCDAAPGGDRLLLQRLAGLSPSNRWFPVKGNLPYNLNFW